LPSLTEEKMNMNQAELFYLQAAAPTQLISRRPAKSTNYLLIADGLPRRSEQFVIVKTGSPDA
jgi:hypothetical protein